MAFSVRSPLSRLVPRKQLDIPWTDLLRGVGAGFIGSESLVSVETPFGREGTITCLSARSALDLLLSGLELPHGSEVLVSAFTIPDIPRILTAHGLVPVPIDLDFATAAVDPALLSNAVGPRTRAILVAHLFGSRTPMEPIHTLAENHELFVIEDAAQAFTGPGFTGDPASDAVLFSFGPIKTSTALGGGVLFVKDRDLWGRLVEIHKTWPQQGEPEHLARLLRFAAFKLLLSRVLYPALVVLIRCSGRDHDEVITGAARSFRKGDFFGRIRRRPSASLRRFVHDRIHRFEPATIQRRAEFAVMILESIPKNLRFGGSGSQHTHWVIPISVIDPEALRHHLLGRGIDATRATSSMAPVPPPELRPELSPDLVRKAFGGILYLPGDPEMTQTQRARYIGILRDWFTNS